MFYLTDHTGGHPLGLALLHRASARARERAVPGSAWMLWAVTSC